MLFLSAWLCWLFIILTFYRTSEGKLISSGQRTYRLLDKILCCTFWSRPLNMVSHHSEAQDCCTFSSEYRHHKFWSRCPKPQIPHAPSSLPVVRRLSGAQQIWLGRRGIRHSTKDKESSPRQFYTTSLEPRKKHLVPVREYRICKVGWCVVK